MDNNTIIMLSIFDQYTYDTALKYYNKYNSVHANFKLKNNLFHLIIELTDLISVP